MRVALQLLSVLLAAPAHGQVIEAVGARAQGMGGAFVAVADDATATWWNPAGIATGAYFNMILERGMVTQPANPQPTGPAWRNTSSSFAVVFPALGLSYYSLRISEIPTVSAAGGRQDQGSGGVAIRSATAQQFGITIGQTLVKGLVLGSTLSLIKAGVTDATSTGSAPLDDADALDTSTGTHGNIDLGVMLSLGNLRAGVTMKHVNEPTFGSGTSMFTLQRQTRAGLALVGGGHGALDAITVDVDADLTKTQVATGETQYIAGGLEAWLAKRRFGIRGGISRNIAQPAGTATSAGLSLGLRTSLYLDGALTFGNDKARDGWDAALRVTF